MYPFERQNAFTTILLHYNSKLTLIMKAKNIRRTLFNLFSQTVVILTVIATHPVYASVTQIPAVHHVRKATDTSLKQFEGFYQFPNKVAYIYFEQRDHNLVARQVWDNRTYLLIRKDDLHFETKDEAYKIEFLKDSLGHLAGVKILERAILIKVNFDPTKVADLPLEQLKPLEGSYQFQRDSNFKLTITARGKGIELKQEWDGKTIFFLPRSANTFLNEDLSFPLTFIVEGGRVKQVICFANDIWNKIK
jgi:hypothetical protein